MNTLEALAVTPLAEGLGWALLHFLWQGTFIALALAAALGFFRPSSPRVRYALACLALLLMPVTFAVTAALSTPTDGVRAGFALPLGAPAGSGTVPPSAPAEWTAPWWELASGHLPWIVPFWAAGVLLFYARALGGWMAAQRLRKAGARPAPALWQERLARLAARVRVSRPVLLLESWRAEVPVVIGFLRPVILMPASALTGLAPEQLEAILVHELGHIRRGDYLVNLLQKLVEGLLFYHPAVWWVSLQVRAEREACCDDLAVALCGNGHAYAAALVALEERRWAVEAPALAATGGRLMGRIRRLLKQPEGPQPGVALALVATLLVVLAGGALAAWQPQGPPAPPKPAALPAPAAPASPAPVAAPPVPAVPPMITPQPAPPVPPAPGQSRDGFAIFAGDNTFMTGWFSNMDTEQARRYGKAEEFIWVRRAGQTYIIRDRGTIQRARELYPEEARFAIETAKWRAESLAEQLRLPSTGTELAPELEQLTRMLRELREGAVTERKLAEAESALAQAEARLQELRFRLAETQARRSAQQAELESQDAERRTLRSDRLERVWRLLDDAIARGLAERIPPQ